MGFAISRLAWLARRVAAGLAAAALASAAPARAQDLGASLLLVAQPKLQGEFYASTVLVAKSIGGGRHIGFIINRPSGITLAGLFPDHDASRKVVDPVYVGGPEYLQYVFALVERSESPGGRSVQLAPGLYVAMDRETIDRIIETDATRARFVAGMVAWQAGELEYELKRGLWFVQEPEASLIVGKRDGLWEELVRRAERRRNGI